MPPVPPSRRQFLSRASLAALGPALLRPSALQAPAAGPANPGEPWDFRISLAQWSLHRTLFAGEMSTLDFPARARSWGLGGVEYVNSFFKDQARDRAFLQELKTRCEGEGVQSLLIMCDGEGRLGDPDRNARLQAVRNHIRWLEAARFLGCHSIRVNAASEGSEDEQRRLAADGLRRLAEIGDTFELNVLVENHGGLSSNGAWLASVMKAVDHPRIGTLPDFGNFHLSGGQWYDRYQGVRELMPWARAVSAKSHDFDEQGNERNTDYRKMLGIVREAGYRGWIGIEYEGSMLPEEEGILATKRLLEGVREEMRAAAG